MTHLEDVRAVRREVRDGDVQVRVPELCAGEVLGGVALVAADGRRQGEQQRGEEREKQEGGGPA